MSFRNTLRGQPIGQLDPEELIKHLEHLSRETVSINVGDQMISSVIVKRWGFDRGTFDIEFFKQALQSLHALGDPRCEIVSLLFNQIK